MDDHVIDCINEIHKEFNAALERYKSLNGAHEGYAVILEELDELWDGIKTNKGPDAYRKEACQVAAMALRFMVELT